MALTKNALTRIQIIDELLSDIYRYYTIDDIVSICNSKLAEHGIDPVTRRCIEKDIKYIECGGPFLAEISRLPVSAYSFEKQKTVTRKCLRYSNPGFSIFKKALSDDEKHLLKEALSLLGQFDGLPNLSSLENLRASLGVEENAKKIISFTRNPIEKTNLLGDLFTRISQKQVIEIEYHKLTSPQYKNKIILHPYFLKEYNRRWYLFAVADSDGKLLNFSLDQIDKCTPMAAHEYIEYDGDLNEHFEDIIGVSLYKENETHKIYFWASNRSKGYISSKPIHESQREFHGAKGQELRQKYPQLIEGAFYRIDCKENYELIRELSSFGKDLIVLEPSNIQEKVYQRANEICLEYKKLRT